MPPCSLGILKLEAEIIELDQVIIRRRLMELPADVFNPSSRLRLMKVLLGSVEHISATAGVVLEVPSSTNTSGTSVSVCV